MAEQTTGNNTSDLENDLEDRQALNKEIIRALANDYIRFKTKQPNQQTNEINEQHTLNRNLSTTERDTIEKARQILRRTSHELEEKHEEFFGNVAVLTQGDSAEQSFRQISEEVLKEENMNWGRVVSLFVYGGRVAEEFWRRRENQRGEEVEEWLSDCVGEREEWIASSGGWVGDKSV